MANERARALRRRMTPHEVKLWVRLRELRPQGYHFRRQAPPGGAIVDFICLRRKLVVEVDGGQHSFARQAAADRERERRLADRGFGTIRFWNADIDGDLDSVVETIWHALQEPLEAAAR